MICGSRRKDGKWMTEKEAIEKIRKEICNSPYCNDNCKYDPCGCAYGMAMDSLEEIQQYRAIGTVEECREAVEKQKAKKPRLNYKPKFFGRATYTCPRCGNCCLEEFANERQNNRYCWDCGQKIDFGGNGR